MIMTKAMRHFFTFLLLCLLTSPAMAANTSGLKLPRFTSLKSNEVNVRTGPGTRYPIQFLYRREGMPVEVIDEYDLWRKIRDVEGATGWVHKTMLDGRRTVMIKSKDSRVVRREPEPAAKPLLKAEPMVVAKLVECEKHWCRILLSGRKGWIEKSYIWGVYPDEVMD